MNRENGVHSSVLDRVAHAIEAARAAEFTPPDREPKDDDVRLGVANDTIRAFASAYASLSRRLSGIAEEMLRMQEEVRKAVPSSVDDDASFEAWMKSNPEMKSKVDLVESMRETHRPDADLMQVLDAIMRAEISLQFPAIHEKDDDQVGAITSDWAIVLTKKEHRRGPLGVMIVSGADFEQMVGRA